MACSCNGFVAATALLRVTPTLANPVSWWYGRTIEVSSVGQLQEATNTLQSYPLYSASQPRWYRCLIDVNISGKKSGTERTKKRKKRELVISTARGRDWYSSLDRPESRYVADFAERIRKRESGMGLKKKREFTPESGSVDIYGVS